MHSLISRFGGGIWESKKRIFLSVFGKEREDEEREQVRKRRVRCGLTAGHNYHAQFLIDGASH